ncbi:MAG: hypothetical protein JSU06_09160 [Actinobacteria bacterium]|nr:hypothetical protein [Actinomycetota bacterium]
MPLGLWKSKWEIHREDMDRYREDMDRYREDVERYREEAREDRARSDRRWVELREETRELRADYDRELAETRLFNREVLIRMEKTYSNLGATLELVGEELHELKAAVKAQTEAIMKLVDRFEEPGGQQPV